MKRLSSLLSKLTLVIALLCTGYQGSLHAQHSIARQWNEVNLQAVRNNGARPTVIARTLFHHSILMYDLWAVYDEDAETYFLGKQFGNYPCPFDGVPLPTDVDAARHEAISYASYRLLTQRYVMNGEVGDGQNEDIINDFMNGLGYDPSITSEDYSSGNPAHLGNYLAAKMIAAGYNDASNQVQNYAAQYYEEVNPNIDMTSRGNDQIEDMNRWQKMTLAAIWDQPCVTLFTGSRNFIGPEWGNVVPFALDDSVKTVYTDDRGTWNVYHDPGPPPLFDTINGDHEDYLWNFELVGTWSSHLDPSDGTLWDISPASIGNIPLDNMPEDYSDYSDFYDFFEGGDISLGHNLNPATGMPYTPQVVKRSDYARVLAEFWADGPDSETPPGHWFTIYNEVSDYPEFTRKWGGVGTVLSDLEYDTKAYFTLGGAVHDAAVAAWGAKGYYDYIRPVAALRAISDKYGQRTDPSSTESYHPLGIDLIPGHIEIIEEGDPLITDSTEYLLNEIKLMCWLGPGNEIPCDSLNDAGTTVEYPTDISGVGWKPIQEWWPYQRPTFVTPPFAGYVSGHSTFSRAAAEVMTAITGDNFFPGGMGVFECPVDSFLVFEEGPSETIQLQWATYQDASDQCSLSRIWGGIHPPCDDIPGRKIGYEVGNNAFTHAQTIFDPIPPQVVSAFLSDEVISDADAGGLMEFTIIFNEAMDTDKLPESTFSISPAAFSSENVAWQNDSTLVFSFPIVDMQEDLGNLTVTVANATDFAGNVQASPAIGFFFLDMENPEVSTASFEEVGAPISAYSFSFEMSETMDESSLAQLETPIEDAMTNSLALSTQEWTSATTHTLQFDLLDAEEELDDIDIQLSNATDSIGNAMIVYNEANVFSIDTKNPSVSLLSASTFDIDNGDHGTGTFSILINFDEDMDASATPVIDFPVEDPLAQALVENPTLSSWLSPQMYEMSYDVIDVTEVLENIDVSSSLAKDLVGNVQVTFLAEDLFSIHLDTALSLIDLSGLPISKVYPNPAKGEEQLTIEFSEVVNALSVELIDLSGQTVRRLDSENAAFVFHLPLRGLSEGMYLLIVQSDIRRSLLKVNVQR